MNKSVNMNANSSPVNVNVNAAPIAPLVPDKEIDRIPTTEKIIVFTFDAGSGDTSLSKILETLASRRSSGTFFVTGQWVEKYPEQLQAIVGDGHDVFNHTYSHPYLTKASDAEIRTEFEKTEKLVYDLTGQSTKPYFRPPYGDRSAHVRKYAASLGYQDVYWTVDALDWKESEGQTATQVQEHILSNLQPGAIILMHVGDTITGQILDSLFTEIQARGYSIKSLSEALGS
jgi:peptidoglycan/xylan/chitin deacetylase (PgdA/CDA1 family)